MTAHSVQVLEGQLDQRTADKASVPGEKYSDCLSGLAKCQMESCHHKKTTGQNEENGALSTLASFLLQTWSGNVQDTSVATDAATTEGRAGPEGGDNANAKKSELVMYNKVVPEESPATTPSINYGWERKPPENFAVVNRYIFRSSYPKVENFGFLKSLGLKTILTLVPEPYPETHVQFMKENGIQHFQIGLPGNKEPFVNIPKTRVVDALKVVLDPKNHPIMIHCNKGKHRTGCVVGCLRKLMGWSLAITFEEYRRYSHPKSRALDQQFIEMWPEDPELVEIVKNSEWLFPKYEWDESDDSCTTDGELSSSDAGDYTDETASVTTI